MKFFLATVLLASLAACMAEDNVVLSPVTSNTTLPEKMMVFIPGGKVPTANYMATAQSIQEAAASTVRLWVVVPAVFQRLCIISCTLKQACSPLHSAVEGALQQAAAKGWKRRSGADSEDIFLAGHSLGGVCANTLLQAYSTSSGAPYKALIVMGSYVDETGNFDLINYPTPVLTLNVELDGGLARPGKTATWWRQYNQIEATLGQATAVSTKPVIVLPHLNHSDFCPGFNVPGDLMAEVSQGDATALIGQMVAAFLALHAGPAVPAAVQTAATDMLADKVGWTSRLLGPYLRAQDMERNPDDTRISGEGSSPFCAHAQHIVAGLGAADDARLDVHDGFHVSSPNLEHCHPNWTLPSAGTTGGGDHLQVDVCSHTDYYADVSNTGEITAASEIACKLLSSDRVAQQLNTTAADAHVDCSAGNKYAVSVAESIALGTTLARYRRSGRGWCFLPDVPTFSNIGPVWVFKDALALKENATCMTVASPVLKTAIDGKIYPGNHYCKYLSPARVLDWMMTDSLKTGK